MQDKTVIPIECGSEFVFTYDEQQFHSEWGSKQPERCKTCRGIGNSDRGGGAGFSDPRQGLNGW